MSALPRGKSFRNRGFTFLKKAGTHRKPLSQSMWTHQRDWIRYSKSLLVRTFPALGPKPLADPDQYRYVVPIKDPQDFSFVLVGDTGLNSPGQYLVSSAVSRQDIYP